jgi:hemoglobin
MPVLEGAVQLGRDNRPGLGRDLSPQAWPPLLGVERALKTQYDGQNGHEREVDQGVSEHGRTPARDERQEDTQQNRPRQTQRGKTMLVDQICAQTGGPCTYTGRSMKEAHANMGITEGEFDALVEDLVTTLKAFNVPDKEQNELLTALGTMKVDIVEVPGPATGTPLPKSFVPAKAP